MSLLQRIQDLLEFEENTTVAERQVTNTVGKPLNEYSVNVRGVVLQFSIPADEDDEGVLEDFLEFIEARVNQM